MKAKFFVDMPTPAGVTDEPIRFMTRARNACCKRDLASSPRPRRQASLVEARHRLRVRRGDSVGKACSAIGKDGMTSRFVPPFKSRRRSLESFGLRTIICSACGQIHPLSADEPDPHVCSNCGKPLQGVDEK